MIPVIDTARYQLDLDLQIPWGRGYRANYTKLGGDNSGRYVTASYAPFIDRSRAVGYRMGHYWVPSDTMDPNGAADYYVDHLRGWTSQDFAVLDNESLDGARLYSDAQAAVWVERVKSRLGIPGSQVLVYYGLADARERRHDAVLATGANFIIAAYSYGPFEFATPSNIPADRIVGHQTGGIVFGGIPTDVNSFKDYAFDYDTAPIDLSKEDEMIYISGDTEDRHALIGPGYVRLLAAGEEREQASGIGRRVDGNDRQFDLWVSMATTGQPTAGNLNLSDSDIERIIAALPTGSLTKADVADAVKSLRFVAQ